MKKTECDSDKYYWIQMFLTKKKQNHKFNKCVTFHLHEKEIVAYLMILLMDYPQYRVTRV
jgi:hypothetical protein